MSMLAQLAGTGFALLIGAADAPSLQTDEPTSSSTQHALAADSLESVIWTARSGYPERQRLVIRDAEAWAAFWNTVHANWSPGPHRADESGPPLPHVDFEKEIVIAAAMGRRPSGGYHIQIEEVARDRGRWIVRVHEHSPGQSCTITYEETSPVHAVRMPRTERLIAFAEQKTTIDCGRVVPAVPF